MPLCKYDKIDMCCVMYYYIYICNNEVLEAEKRRLMLRMTE